MKKQQELLPLSDGVELFFEYFESSEKNKNVVFINGMFQCVLDWYPLKDLLLNNFNILLYDLRGQGNTKIQDQEISMDRHVQDIYELISYLNLKEINIVGMDIGNIIGLLFSNNYPDKVKKSVFLGITYGPRFEMIIDDWKYILELLGDFAFFKFLLPWLFSDNFIKTHSQDISSTLDFLIEKNPMENVLKQFSSMMPYPDVKYLLQQLKHDFITIIGEDDALVSVNSIKTLMKDIKKMDCVFTISGAGHFLIDEYPEYLMEKINEFI